ncbi:SDR family NAD(P)-dependent oxidoreductase [Streptomyces sp. NBC_01275]|uniref:SDR family NAD(P)-dependent oxidoreductase n=1 Tax=Streptomyces sp. NBC_01275 TaxID=2903807 RepID=UPI002257FC45|nr:SDR family NAD(P)-dependent oxidoreductase [Streptomyces sp. NBC_01275]MCX4767599.1 SDR family NAD(P)-dependent oxidoreductase [Streptomyces sp. NBC_01275]
MSSDLVHGTSGHPVNGAAFDGSTVVVTGAGSGVGRTTALAFALRGARVLVTDADARGAHGTVEAIGTAGGYAVAVVGDPGAQEVADDVVSTALCSFGGLDVLVHGTTDPTDAEETLTRSVLAHMLTAGGGSLVFTADGHGVADRVASLDVAYRARGVHAHAVDRAADARPDERVAAVLLLAQDALDGRSVP